MKRWWSFVPLRSDVPELEGHLPAPATDRRSIFTLRPQPHRSILCAE